MRTLLGTTALAVAISASAFAQTAVQAPGARQTTPAAGAAAETMAWLAHGDVADVHASDVIGATIYAADEGEDTADARTDWDSVGVVNDLLLTRDGEVRAVLVDVGTFLGMGGKTVAAPLDTLRYVTEDPADASDVDDFFIVIMTDRETLQAAPAYVRPSTDVKSMSMSANAPGAGDPLMFSQDGYSRTETTALTVDDLKDATVYGADNGEIGEISQLIVTKEGRITDAVIDVGGFLGMGERAVAIPFSDLTVLRKIDGDDLRVYVDATREKLEAMPRYDN